MRAIIWKGFSWVMENMTIVGMVIFVVMFLTESIKNTALEFENKNLNSQLLQQRLISDNAYTSISIFDRISGATIDAKQQNTLDAQTTKKDVKVILVDNDCAPVTAPDGLIDRMRQYKD